MSRLRAVACFVVAGACGAPSSSGLTPWASRRLACPAERITFTPVGGDCLDKPFTDAVPRMSDCDVAARGCDRYVKFIHAPGGDWYEVR